MRITDYWMYGLLAIIAVIIGVSFYAMQKDANNQFNVLDLLMENGRTSRIAAAFNVALISTTWVFIKLSVDGKMTEGYMLTYGGMWVTPIISRMFSTNQVTSSSTTTTTTAQESVVVPKEIKAKSK